MIEFQKEYFKLEYGKGYKSLMILCVLGYIGSTLYLLLGIMALTKSVTAGLLAIFGASMGYVSVYVFNKIGHAVFIVRDIQIKKTEETKT